MKKIHLGNARWQIIACLLLLSTISLLCLWGIEQPGVNGNVELLRLNVVKQTIFIGAALIALILISHISFNQYRKFSYALYGLCIVAIILILIFGKSVRGMKGWISVGPFTLQPSEFMKVALVMALARYMMYQKNLSSVRGLLGPFLLSGVPMFLVLLQPDLGTAMIFFPVCIAMLYAAGARVRHLISVFLLSAMLAVTAYFFVLKDYQKDRLIAFASPDKVSRDKTLQQTRSQWAIGAGGLTGRGLGESLLYSVLVPDKHTDFIFSVIGEEFGWMGCTLVLILYGIVFYLSMKIAYESREPYGKLLVVGMVTFIAAQMLINIGMTIGLAPITGITLPFLSYGGSSLLTVFIAVAMVLGVGRNWVPSFASRDFEFRTGQIRTELGNEKLIK